MADLKRERGDETGNKRDSVSSSFDFFRRKVCWGKEGTVRSKACCEFGTFFSSGLEDRSVMIGRKVYENHAFIAAPTMCQISQDSWETGNQTPSYGKLSTGWPGKQISKKLIHRLLPLLGRINFTDAGEIWKRGTFWLMNCGRCANYNQRKLETREKKSMASYPKQSQTMKLGHMNKSANVFHYLNDKRFTLLRTTLLPFSSRSMAAFWSFRYSLLLPWSWVEKTQGCGNFEIEKGTKDAKDRMTPNIFPIF